MKDTLTKSLYILLSFIVMPMSSLAQDTGIVGGEDDTGVTGGNEPFRLNNPLGDQTLMGFLQDLLEVIMIFAVPLIVFMIIYAGFLFVMDRGSSKTLEQAKRALLYAIIGGLLILGAWVILEVIQGTVDAFRT